MNPIDVSRVRAHLQAAAARFDVHTVDTVDSTNSELERMAARGAGSGTVLVAATQTAGRGRRGRSWYSAPASSLTFSVLWRFPSQAAGLSGLSLAVGLALARGLEGLGAQGVFLKWPNDLLFCPLGVPVDQARKMGGILIELSPLREGTQAILGIGLNREAPVLQETGALAGAGVHEALPMGSVPDPEHLLASVLSALLEVLENFTVDGLNRLKNDWSARHIWQGQPVRVLDAGRLLLEGTCLGIDAQGQLLLDTASGVQAVVAGDVSLRPA